MLGRHSTVVRTGQALSIGLAAVLAAVTRNGTDPRPSACFPAGDASSKALHDASPAAAHDTGHRDALVLVTTIGPSTGEGTAPCPAQPPPPNPTAEGLDGSRESQILLRRVGEDTHISTRIPAQ